MDIQQLGLPLRLPPRKKKSLPTRVSLARNTLTVMVEAGLWQGNRAARLLNTIQRMKYDDCLYCRDNHYWRLEFCYLKSGYPHYRLYYRGQVFGIADIRIDTRHGAYLGDSRQLPYVQQYLAVYLVALGFTAENTVLVEGDARTSLNADTTREARLFRVCMERIQASA